MNTLFFILSAYLLGSIPFGLLVGLMAKRIDIREHGSKNIGATNVFRVIGKKWGMLALFLDILKGYLACSLPLILGFSDYPITLKIILGTTAILGHTFPVWLKFRGGKGVATALGAFLAVMWLPTVLAFGIWVISMLIFRIISISSLIATSCFPILVFGIYRSESHFTILFSVSVLLAILIFYTHRANIGRLRQGTEKKIL